MLKITGLSVSAGKKKIISRLSLTLRDGEVHLIMGPNGAGKSTLALALMGHPLFRSSGSILLGKKELSGLGPDERARAGMFLAFQDPKEVEGVKASSLVRKAVSAREGGKQGLDRMVEIQGELASSAQKLGLDKSFISRELNVGFSGGEKKRMEMLQMMVLKPDAVIMDEVDSGLDVDGIRLISKAISSMRNRKRCFLIITHYPRMLKYIRPDYVHIMAKGGIIKSGGAELAAKVEEHGYSSFLKGSDD